MAEQDDSLMEGGAARYKLDNTKTPCYIRHYIPTDRDPFLWLTLQNEPSHHYLIIINYKTLEIRAALTCDTKGISVCSTERVLISSPESKLVLPHGDEAIPAELPHNARHY
ncbi:50S ribosomal protein L18 [Dissostichus eleginoides]|uniref:50S ribosomal protein L18 n=1 Tax=Dissostichus eleginoides TaxID=100907 RepID=A0AAD9BBK6_DISEL|nr:50S ribosomal protein L18 [Dissostichus eleginoides]